MSEQVPAKVVFVLSVSVAAVSTAAILVRLVPSMHPIAIAFWRTALIAVVLGPWLFRHRPAARYAGWIALAGGCLALHFWAWFASLQHTTVMRSTVLVCLTPVWAGLLEWGVLRQPPRKAFWWGVGIALIGVATMTSIHQTTGSSPTLLGDGLAMAGGILAGVYLTIGRSLRPHIAIGPYGALICGACALWLLPAAAATGASLVPPGPAAWLVLCAMALGPQLLGHVGFNYAVGYIPASVVGAVVLLEPVGATILANWLFDEVPSIGECLGALTIVAGVLVATLPLHLLWRPGSTA